jgi:hypothetical protein
MPKTNKLQSMCFLSVRNYCIQSTENYNASNDTLYQIPSSSNFLMGLVVAKLNELGQLDEMLLGQPPIKVQHILEMITGETLHELITKYIFSKINRVNKTISTHPIKLCKQSGWISMNDLHVIIMDICKSYNRNSGKILRSSVNFIQNRVGPFVYDNNKFVHDTWNYGTTMNYTVNPLLGNFDLSLCEYDKKI